MKSLGRSWMTGHILCLCQVCRSNDQTFGTHYVTKWSNHRQPTCSISFCTLSNRNILVKSLWYLWFAQLFSADPALIRSSGSLVGCCYASQWRNIEFHSMIHLLGQSWWCIFVEWYHQYSRSSGMSAIAFFSKWTAHNCCHHTWFPPWWNSWRLKSRWNQPCRQSS